MSVAKPDLSSIADGNKGDSTHTDIVSCNIFSFRALGRVGKRNGLPFRTGNGTTFARWVPKRYVRLYSRKAACKQKPIRFRGRCEESFDGAVWSSEKMLLRLSGLFAMSKCDSDGLYG
jgi:hypothetical protein